MPLTPPPRQRLSDDVFTQLRDAIITSELAPGQTIRDTDLAAQFGLSRTPVREALARLIAMGLVESKPGSYTRVTPIDRADIDHTLTVLCALTEVAIRTGVPRLSATCLSAMRTANARFHAAASTGNTAQAIDADDSFHRVILTAAQNPYILRFMDELTPKIHRILHRKFSTLIGGQDTFTHHAALIELYENRDIDGAVTCSTDHWNHLRVLINELFDTNQMKDPHA